jgi:hypothetical protein
MMRTDKRHNERHRQSRPLWRETAENGDPQFCATEYPRGVETAARPVIYRRIGDLIDDMRQHRQCDWTADRRHVFADGTTLKLETSDIGGGSTRAVLFDQNGKQTAASDWCADPSVRIVTPVARLRGMVDALLGQQ